MRIFVFLSLLCFLSCAKDPKNAGTGDTATSGAFELIADETLKPCIDSLVFGFNSQTPNAKVTVRYKNATEALDDLLQSKTRLVLIGRPLSKKERAIFAQQQYELTEADVAENAIACIVNEHNPLQSISLDSLRQIIQNKDKTILRVSTSYLSSTEFILDSVFDQESYQSGKIARFQTSDSVIDRIRGDNHAIGFINASWLKKISNSGDSSIHALKISVTSSDKPVMLHLAYIYQGLYPLVSRICAYTCEVPNTLPRGFLAYAMSADGQRVFFNYDLLPKTQILKLIPAQ